MDTRVLYIVADCNAAISGGYYYYSGKAKNWMLMIAQYDLFSKGYQFDSNDEQGNLYVRAKVDRLEQNMQKKHQS
jgi:lipopolysaccharide export system protein LptC